MFRECVKKDLFFFSFIFLSLYFTLFSLYHFTSRRATNNLNCSVCGLYLIIMHTKWETNQMFTTRRNRNRIILDVNNCFVSCAPPQQSGINPTPNCLNCESNKSLFFSVDLFPNFEMQQNLSFWWLKLKFKTLSI